MALLAGVAGVAYLSSNERTLIEHNLPVVEQARQLAAASAMITQALLDIEQAETPERRQIAVGTLADRIAAAADKRDALRQLQAEARPLAALAGPLDRLHDALAKFRDRAADILRLSDKLTESRQQAEVALRDLELLNGTLIANIQAEISASLSGLYEPLEPAARERTLDKLSERDLFKLQSYLEQREAMERAAARLGTAFAADPAEIAKIKTEVGSDLGLARRRAIFIEDLTYRAQVVAKIEAIEGFSGPSGLLGARAGIVAAQQDISRMTRSAFADATDLATAAREAMRGSERNMLDLQTRSLAMVRSSAAVFGLLAIFAVAAGVWTALFVRRRVMERLRLLLDRLVALGRGEMQWSLPVSGDDDIGQMEAALAIVREEVKRKHRLELQLQAEVAERTELYKAEMLAHDRARAEAENASRAKAEFLAIMSHEIRTPLNGLTGMLRLIAPPADRDAARKLDLARRSAADLTALLDDILEHAKVEFGSHDLHVADFELRDLVRRVADQMTPLAAAKNILFLPEIDPELPPALRGDRIKIQQILVNLCSNAIKFTHHGEVALNVQAERDLPGGLLRVHFRVTDTGVGMTREVLERVFEAFEQGHSPLDPRAAGGTGLGLAICRSLTLRLGGQLTVESEPGLGSSFALTLDMPVGNLAVALEANNPHEMAPALPKIERTALLVEDHDISRLVAREYLEQLGVTVHEAASGADAIALAETRPFDLILMDLDLPDLTGAETARRIRRLPAHRSTPIVAVSAHVSAATSAPGEGFAFAALLPKPLSPSGLARIVQDCGGEALPDTPAPDRPLIPDDDPVRAAVNQDADVLGASRTADILQAFVAHARQDVADLVQSFAGGDAAVTARRAHRLRGAASNYALHDLMALAQAIERNPDVIDPTRMAQELSDALRSGLLRLRQAATERGIDLRLD